MELMLVGRLVIAALLGGLLGLERSIVGKHAGVRTYAMVSLGSCLFVGIEIIATLQLSFFAGLNPLQLAGSVIIGIGFIGAGLSSLRGEHPELTTASGIWVAAGIGMACGFGFYTLAVATALLGLVIFSVIAKLEHNISTRFGTKHEE